MIKINFGCFKQMFAHGWINVDILDLSQYANDEGLKFKYLDITEQPLTWNDDTVNLIYHSHLVEHLPFEVCVMFLNECYRILKPKGLMRLTTPDLQVLLDKYNDKEMSEFTNAQPNGYNKFDSESLKLSFMLFGNFKSGYNQTFYRGHFMCYDEEGLIELLLKVGFSDIKRMKFSKSQSRIMETETYDTWEGYSLILECIKK